MIHRAALIVGMFAMSTCVAEARPSHDARAATQAHVSAIAPASSAGRAGSRYRFARPPLLLFARDGEAYDFDVYVHLNRALPRTAARPDASILIARSAPDFRPITLSRKPACYTTEKYTGDSPPPPALRAPRDGQPIRVSLRVQGKTVAETTARAKKVSRSLFGDKERLTAELRSIGCPRAM